MIIEFFMQLYSVQLTDGHVQSGLHYSKVSIRKELIGAITV